MITLLAVSRLIPMDPTTKLKKERNNNESTD